MKSRKSKIAIIISGPIYIRNYLLTNAFSEIEKNNEIILLITKDLQSLKNDNRFKKYKIIDYKYNNNLKKLARFINELSLFKNYSLCKNFAYRIKRKYNDSPHLNDGTTNARRVDHRLKVFILKSIFKIIARRKILSFAEFFTKKIFSRYSPIQKFLRTYEINTLICPCSAAGTEEFDIGAFTSEFPSKTKTILVIDNWDNLSSKYIMSYQPSHTIVWGEQTRLHGITYQGINPNNITALGTPRFFHYSKGYQMSEYDKNKLPILPEKYILFLGSQTFFDENTILEKLKILIKERFNGFEIIYRPHPWRETFGRIIKPPRGIIIDPTLTKDSETYGSILLPKLDLYKHIISNSNLIIGGCTSMIVECSLLKKPYLLLAHDDGNPIQSPFEYYKASEHQNLTAILNNVSVCFSIDTLHEKINYLLNKKILDNDPVLEYIISSKYSRFDYHLNKLVEELS